ncbi:hypothetical protein LY76DRAFT_216401 [Colletotrichum caudatum]|nr:hypothetical protein LY76DRAFT_216401 [Colletotrichum caudatum]
MHDGCNSMLAMASPVRQKQRVNDWSCPCSGEPKGSICSGSPESVPSVAAALAKPMPGLRPVDLEKDKNRHSALLSSSKTGKVVLRGHWLGVTTDILNRLPQSKY